MRRAAILLAALTAFFSSCSRPDSVETFIKVADAPAGIYDFSVDMSDSLATYDLLFYTRVDNPSGFGKSIPLEVSWISPDSERALVEKVYLGSGDLRGVREEYRTGVNPVVKGVWTLRVRPEDTPRGFRGIGLIVRTDGTR